MSGAGRSTTQVIPGSFALSVGHADMPTATGWEWAHLRDVALLESGHTPSRAVSDYWGGDIYWIGIKDARENHARRITSTLQSVTQAGIDNSSARVLPSGTVCLSRTASVGYVTIMDRPMATSQDFVNWVCSGALLPEFLMYLFVAEKDSLLRFGKGTTHTTIYFPEVEAFRVCIPPLNEQRRIVAKLDALMDRIRKTRETLDAIPPLLEQFRQSVLAAAFRGDLTKEWREKNPDVEPASVLLEKIRQERRRKWETDLRAKGKDPTKFTFHGPESIDDSALFELPEGWHWASLEEICPIFVDCAHRTPRYSNGGFPALRPRDVVNGVLQLDTAERVSLEEFEKQTLRRIPEPGDVVYSRELSFGWAAVLPEDAKVCLSQGMLLVRPGEGLLSEYLSMYLNSPHGRGQALSFAIGSAHPHLNISDIRRFAVAIASEREGTAICRLLDRHLRKIDDIQAIVGVTITQANLLEQSILAKAFRGELVPQDPTDEPASVLLERIRAERAAQPVKKGRKATGDEGTAKAMGREKQDEGLLTPSSLPLSGGGGATRRPGRPKKLAIEAADLPDIPEIGLDDIEKQLRELEEQEALLKAALKAKT